MSIANYSILTAAGGAAALLFAFLCPFISFFTAAPLLLRKYKPVRISQMSAGNNKYPSRGGGGGLCW